MSLTQWLTRSWPTVSCLLISDGDFQFRADAIHAADQHRMAVLLRVQREQTAEPADGAEHFRPARPANHFR